MLTAQTFQKKSMDRSEEFNYSRRVVIAELGGNSDVETNEKTLLGLVIYLVPLPTKLPFTLFRKHFVKKEIYLEFIFPFLAGNYFWVDGLLMKA